MSSPKDVRASLVGTMASRLVRLDVEVGEGEERADGGDNFVMASDFPAKL